MPISGLVIRIDPSQRDAVKALLSAIDNLELPETPPGGKLVAVIDAPSMQAEETIFKQISDIPGVFNVSLSYHNFEDLTE